MITNFAKVNEAAAAAGRLGQRLCCFLSPCAKNVCKL